MLSGALAGARHATSAPVPNKTALVAGAAGKLGERILARFLASPGMNC